jgi:Flp pilus assembly pilin Flp
LAAGAGKTVIGTFLAVKYFEYKGTDMFKFLKNFTKDECGAAMVEYAIALLVAAGVGVATFSTMGTAAGANAEKACDALTGGAVATCDQN